MAQLVAHHTGSVGVTGSSPVSSTGLNPGRGRDAVVGVFDYRKWRHLINKCLSDVWMSPGYNEAAKFRL